MASHNVSLRSTLVSSFHPRPDSASNLSCRCNHQPPPPPYMQHVPPFPVIIEATASTTSGDQHQSWSFSLQPIVMWSLLGPHFVLRTLLSNISGYVLLFIWETKLKTSFYLLPTFQDGKMTMFSFFLYLPYNLYHLPNTNTRSTNSVYNKPVLQVRHSRDPVPSSTQSSLLNQPTN
jgi:hypothetical protein